MEVDIFLLDFAIKHNIKAILRFYSWANPTISLGRHQDESVISNEIRNIYNLEIVKRPSGGRAVLHIGDISYSFVSSTKSIEGGESVILSYKIISSAIIQGLKKLGISDLYISDSKELYTKSHACISTSTGSDVEYNGCKILGSAQFRKEGYLMQHGSLQIKNNKDLLCSIMNLDKNSIKYTSVQSVLKAEQDNDKLFKKLKIGFESFFKHDYRTMSLSELGYKN